MPRVGWYGLRLRDELRILQRTYSSDARARLFCGLIFLMGGLLVATALVVAAGRSITGEGLTTIFSLRREGGVSEFYEYALSALVVILMGALYRKSRRRSVLFVSVLYGFILLDNSWAFHERFGSFISANVVMPSAWDLRTSDLGEMLAWISAGLVLLPLLIWCLARTTREDVGVYVLFGTITFALIFFAVGVDFFHAMFRELGAERVLGLVEDGGELMILCLAAASAVLYHRGAWRGEQEPSARTRARESPD